MPKLIQNGSVLFALGILAACSTRPDSGDLPTASRAAAAPVAVDLRMRETPDDPYRNLTRVTVPSSHTIGDGMFPYEGIGWENGFVGYRLYLDGRLTSDAFGKQQSAPALAQVSAAGRYHDLASWGMDVLHVGPSLGMGGLGVIRDDKPTQFGKIARIEARIEEAGPDLGAFTIKADGISVSDKFSGSTLSRYSIGRNSPMTRVSVVSSGDLSLATGVAANAKGEFLQSSSDAKGRWRYIATFGTQSENKDNLGLAVFYRSDQARYGGLANETHFIAFNAAVIEYGFLAVWERDANGIRDKAGFLSLLERELAELNAERTGSK